MQKKQAQEVIFSRKSKAISHPPLVFNNNNVMQATSQKHLRITNEHLDTRLSFEKHLEIVLCKINKTIGLIRKLQNLLPRLVRSHYMKLSFIFTLIMVIFFMIKPAIHRFIRSWSLFNTMLFSYYWSNRWFIKGGMIQRTRIWIFTITPLV